MSLFRKKSPALIPYDPETREPAVRRSICTGEMTLGFIDRATGQFHEYICVRTPAELEEYRRRLGVAEIRTIY